MAVTKLESWMHHLVLSSLLSILVDNCTLCFSFACILEGCLNHTSVGARELGKNLSIWTLTLDTLLSSKEIEALCINESTSTTLKWGDKTSLVDSIGSNVYLVDKLLSNDDSIIALEVKDTVLVDVFTNLISSMINLVELDQIAFVVSVDRKIFSINNTELFSLTALRVYTEYVITLLELQVPKFDDLCIEHHLEDFLSVVLLIDCHNIQIVAGILILK